MHIHSKPILMYRWIVFLLAAGYAVFELVSHPYDTPAGPFRFLTIWALFLSFYSASRMLALSEHRITRQHEVTAICAAVVNVMVVYMYWRLFFINPDLVNSRGDIPWYRQYYLHALGPALQIVDAAFIARAFRRVHRAILPVCGIVIAYVIWIEYVLQPLGDQPSGSVTSGLPYPFLNNMEMTERLIFYASNVGLALGLLIAFAALGWLIGKALPQDGSAANKDASPVR